MLQIVSIDSVMFIAMDVVMHSCCMICNIYSTVGRSIANIYNQGNRGYGPTYRATYNILYGECANGEPF